MNFQRKYCRRVKKSTTVIWISCRYTNRNSSRGLTQWVFISVYLVFLFFVGRQGGVQITDDSFFAPDFLPICP